MPAKCAAQLVILISRTCHNNSSSQLQCVPLASDAVRLSGYFARGVNYHDVNDGSRRDCRCAPCRRGGATVVLSCTAYRRAGAHALPTPPETARGGDAVNAHAGGMRGISITLRRKYSPPLAGQQLGGPGEGTLAGAVPCLLFGFRAFLNHLIHQTIIARFFRRHPEIAIGIFLYALERLSGMMRDDFIQACARP